jgi:protein N-lysine methyltransferase METTL21A
MFQLMKDNIRLNDLEGRVEAAIYDWGSPIPMELPKSVDVLLAADCVYFEPAFPLLQQTLRDLMGKSTICFFCFKKRRRADLHFMKTVKRDFCVEEVTDDPNKALYSRQNIFLYRNPLWK